MSTFIRVSLVASILASSGCAGVNFYSDPGLTKSTGIPLYAPKPYVLVSRTGAKDKPVEVSVVWLNDTQRVIYADPRSGFGSAKLTMALANGQLTNFGQETDPKISELITSLGGFLTARATAEKTRAEAAEIRERALQAAQATDVGPPVLKIGEEIARKIKGNELPGLSETEMKSLASAAQSLINAGNLLSDPANAPSHREQLEIVKVQAERLEKIGTPSTSGDSREASLQVVRTWAAALKKLFVDSQAGTAMLPDFELYEIVQNQNGTTSLRRVGP